MFPFQSHHFLEIIVKKALFIPSEQWFLYSVSQLVREAQTMKEQRDQQIAELKTLAEQSGETAQHGFEKKVSKYLPLYAYLLS